MRLRKHSLSEAVAGLLLSAALGCGGQEMQIERLQYELNLLYAEPADSVDPALVFPRDLLCLQNRLYVLDGRLSQVAVIKTGTGQLLGTFGGIGQGPGELGQFPYALVTDGSRVGVAHLFHVSWFTPTGLFLEVEPIPPLDIATPSLQFSSGGWLYNASYHGPGSPLAAYVTRAGDTFTFGSAVTSQQPDAIGLASMELNAVHACRFEDGNVILGWSQENRIEVFSPRGATLVRDSWAHFLKKEASRPDGRLRNLPAYTFNASLGADGLAYLLDGTRRIVRAYDSRGRLCKEHRLREPVIQLAWSGAGLAYAIDGSDRVFRLRLLGAVGKAGEADREMAAGGTAADEPRDSGGASSLLPGELVEQLGNLKSLFRQRGILREGRLAGMGSRPNRIMAIGGRSLIYLGYEDGQGLLLGESPGKGWSVASIVSAHPEGSLRSHMYMAGDRPALSDPRLGLFTLEGARKGIRWPTGVWPSSVVWLGGTRWLVHDTVEQKRDPLFTVDLGTGLLEPAGGAGSHRRAGLLFKPAYNWWHLARWDENRILVFDESLLRLAYWSINGLSPWEPVTGSGLRTIDERRKGLTPESDMDGLVALSGIGALIYYTDFTGEDLESTVTLISHEGATVGRWNLPLNRYLRSMTIGPGGRVFLNTDDILYEWVGAREGFRALLGAVASRASP